MGHVILWKFPRKVLDILLSFMSPQLHRSPDHVIRQLVDYGLPCLAGFAAAALLGLDVEDLVQDPLGGVNLATE